MGNRAIITSEKKDVGIYLHWNGGRDSVEAFLRYCDMKDYRSPEVDHYGWARLAQVIGNFFGGGLSIGILAGKQIDGCECDNGIYIIKDWKIVGRENFSGQEQRSHELGDMLHAIDEKQPESEQLPLIKEIKENEIPTRVADPVNA